MKLMKSASGLTSDENETVWLKVIEMPQPVPQNFLKSVLALRKSTKCVDPNLYANMWLFDELTSVKATYLGADQMHKVVGIGTD